MFVPALKQSITINSTSALCLCRSISFWTFSSFSHFFLLLPFPLNSQNLLYSLSWGIIENPSLSKSLLNPILSLWATVSIINTVARFVYHSFIPQWLNLKKKAFKSFYEDKLSLLGFISGKYGDWNLAPLFFKTTSPFWLILLFLLEKFELVNSLLNPFVWNIFNNGISVQIRSKLLYF